MIIADYKPGDEIAILELFKASFNKDLSLDFWNWRFRDNPVRKFMIKLMWDNDVLAGHYAVCPTQMMIEGNSVLTSLSMTTMTHPNYAGRGIFSKLAEELYHDIHNEFGVAAVWGFPNTNSHYGFIKNLAWRDLAVIPTLSMKTSRFKGGGKMSISHINDFDEKHVNGFREVTSGFSVKTDRSLAYLKWRFIQNPVNVYDVFELEDAGSSYYAVTKKFKSFSESGSYEVDILETSFPAESGAVGSLVATILDHYRSFNISKINLWLPLTDPRHIHFEKNGFSYEPPLTYLGIRAFDAALKPKVDDFRNWFFAMSDSDVF